LVVPLWVLQWVQV
jgi:hypothetical protein